MSSVGQNLPKRNSGDFPAKCRRQGWWPASEMSPGGKSVMVLHPFVARNTVVASVSPISQRFSRKSQLQVGWFVGERPDRGRETSKRHFWSFLFTWVDGNDDFVGFFSRFKCNEYGVGGGLAGDE